MIFAKKSSFIDNIPKYCGESLETFHPFHALDILSVFSINGRRHSNPGTSIWLAVLAIVGKEITFFC